MFDRSRGFINFRRSYTLQLARLEKCVGRRQNEPGQRHGVDTVSMGVYPPLGHGSIPPGAQPHLKSCGGWTPVNSKIRGGVVEEFSGPILRGGG